MIVTVNPSNYVVGVFRAFAILYMSAEITKI